MRPGSEISGIFSLFFDGAPVSYRQISTGTGETDRRLTLIADTAEGGRYVIKLADNDFTFPEKIKMWQRTAEEYLALGYYCPKIYADKSGGFPKVSFEGHGYLAYAEEFAVFEPLEDRSSGGNSDYRKYMDDIWSMTAKVAARHFGYTSYPSGYCLFETFCPSDEVDEVLENALEWKKYAGTLPDRFQGQVQRIWELWTANRAALEKIYGELPASVFQADLNPTNILVDGNGIFAGIFDFNLCGRDVFLNYLMRENLHPDFDEEIGLIRRALEISCAHYCFSEAEKAAALMLYRCVKPLWSNKLEVLKQLGSDPEKLGAFLDRTEQSLTAETDLRSYMGQG